VENSNLITHTKPDRALKVGFIVTTQQMGWDLSLYHSIEQASLAMWVMKSKGILEVFLG
jgi:hypothetical protein